MMYKSVKQRCASKPMEGMCPQCLPGSYIYALSYLNAYTEEYQGGNGIREVSY